VEQEILIVVASLVVHCCAVVKNIIVASQLYDRAVHSRPVAFNLFYATPLKQFSFASRPLFLNQF